MRVLKFVVNKQKLCLDSSCNFSGIVKGTKGYLKAEFNFSEEYDGLEKIAVFEKLGEQYPVRIGGNVCTIPEEVLTYNVFKVCIIGINPNYRICTNYVEVRQDG